MILVHILSRKCSWLMKENGVKSDIDKYWNLKKIYICTLLNEYLIYDFLYYVKIMFLVNNIKVIIINLLDNRLKNLIYLRTEAMLNKS